MVRGTMFYQALAIGRSTILQHVHEPKELKHIEFDGDIHTWPSTSIGRRGKGDKTVGDPGRQLSLFAGDIFVGCRRSNQV
jgi:hypothetical protein